MGDAIVTRPEVFLAATSKDASFDSTMIFPLVGWESLSIQQLITSAAGLTGSSILQTSIDKTNWDDYPGSSHSFTGNESFTWHLVQHTGALWLKVMTTISSGSATFAQLATGTKTIT